MNLVFMIYNSSVFFYSKGRTGSGMISACGGNGFAGGGGGRVSVDVFSRHDEPKIYVHGEDCMLLHCLAVSKHTLQRAFPVN